MQAKARWNVDKRELGWCKKYLRHEMNYSLFAQKSIPHLWHAQQAAVMLGKQAAAAATNER